MIRCTELVVNYIYVQDLFMVEDILFLSVLNVKPIAKWSVAKNDGEVADEGELWGEVSYHY